MTNRPKAIGTAGETAVTRFLQAHGFPHAERRALRGGLDAGDITGTPGVAWEVKAGKAAKTASDGQVAAWMLQTDLEKFNAKADLGILVMARSGIGPLRAGEWWAIVPLHHVNPFLAHTAPVRMHLKDCVRWLRELGYGTPLPEPCTDDLAAAPVMASVDVL